MKRLKMMILTLAAVLGIGTALLVPVPAGAVDVYQPCDNNSDTAVCASQGDNVGTIMRNIINVLLFVVGAISVIMLIVGGILFATSGGDQNAVTRAKGTITYAVVGLVVSLLAYAIVNWVVALFF